MAIRYFRTTVLDARSEYDSLLDDLSSGHTAPLASVSALLYLGNTLQECVDLGCSDLIARGDWDVSDFPGVYKFLVFDVCAAIGYTDEAPFSPLLIGCARFNGAQDREAIFIELANRISKKSPDVPIQDAERP